MNTYQAKMMQPSISQSEQLKNGPVQKSPIYTEFEDINGALGSLEANLSRLLERFQPVLLLDQTEAKPQTGQAPSTGCEVKDRLARIRERIYEVNYSLAAMQERCLL